MTNKIQELRQMGNELSILYVEDEKDLRENVQTYLKKFFSKVYVAIDGKEGLHVYEKKLPNIVISDILMPNMNGIEMIKEIKKINPKQYIAILSAYSESSYIMDAIYIGISSYIIKPIDFNQLNDTLHNIATQITQDKKILMYQENLEGLVQEQLKVNQGLQEKRIEDYKSILMALVDIIEGRDSYTAGHSKRVAQYSKALAKTLGYGAEDCDLIYRASILHDIGKIATPDAILLKPSRLSNLEYSLIKEHVNTGISILKKIPYFQPLIDIIISHHERYDGKGYPNGLKKDEISPLAKIMIVADAFDAMTTSRIYKHKKSIEEALVELENNKYKQFHPEVVDAAVRTFKDIKIEENISQLPKNKLEEQRFAYFYKDRITDLFNIDYLSLILMQNSYSSKYKNMRLISLHEFKNYNYEHGWEKGDLFLKQVAKELTTVHSKDTLSFRLHANDFIFISCEKFPDSKELKECLNFLDEYLITYSVFDIDLDKQKLFSIKDLERFMAKQ